MMKRILEIALLCIFISALLLSSAHAFKFGVISDVRAGALDSALEFISAENVEFIILPGDYCYDGQDYYSHFVKYGFEVRPDLPADQQRVYFVLGNHDAPPIGNDVFINYIAPYYPQNGPAQAPVGTVFFFDRENCHFVITNQYWNNPRGGYTGEQLDWINQNLAGSDRAFKFVFGHEPSYPLNRHVGDSLDADPAQRDLFWDILSENNVQAFFCGHTHNLSHVLYNGVYQIDNGEVRSSPVCVTIVDVTGEEAIIKSYKTNGSVPEPEITPEDSGDLAIETRIALNERPDMTTGDVEVIFSAGPASESGSAGASCFICTADGSPQL